MVDGGRYGRGGYRGNRGDEPVKVGVGKEKKREGEGPIALDANLMSGDNLGPQDPNAFPGSTSDVGGPEVEIDKGGLGVPDVGPVTPPQVAGDRERQLEELEQEVATDLELTPEVKESEEEKTVDEVVTPESPAAPSPSMKSPEPQSTPEDLPSDGATNEALAAEPADEAGTEGRDLRLGDIAARDGKSVDEAFGEPDSSRQLVPENAPQGSEEAKDDKPDEDDDIDITPVVEDKAESGDEAPTF